MQCFKLYLKGNPVIVGKVAKQNYQAFMQTQNLKKLMIQQDQLKLAKKVASRSFVRSNPNTLASDLFRKSHIPKFNLNFEPLGSGYLSAITETGSGITHLRNTKSPILSPTIQPMKDKLMAQLQDPVRMSRANRQGFQ